MEAAADAEAAEGFERTAQVAAARGEVNGLQAKVLDLQQQLEAATEREQAARKTAHTESEERLKMVVDELQRVEAASDASEKSQRKKVEELEQSLAAKTAAVDVLQVRNSSVAPTAHRCPSRAVSWIDRQSCWRLNGLDTD